MGVVVAFLLGISVLYGYADFARLADPYFRGVILAASRSPWWRSWTTCVDWPFMVKLGGADAGGTGGGRQRAISARVSNLPYLGAVDARLARRRR